MLSVIPEDRSKDAWIAATWKQEWEASGPTRAHRHVSDPGEGVKGEELSRKHWTNLNRLRTGVGRYRASMKKRGLADSAACECGEPEQTADHIINSCPLHRPPSEAGLFEVGPLTRAWLQQTELNIYETMIYDRRRRLKWRKYYLWGGPGVVWKIIRLPWLYRQYYPLGVSLRIYTWQGSLFDK